MQQKSLGETARAIFIEALAACNIETAMLAKIEAHGVRYTLRGSANEAPIEIDLAGMRRVVVIAAGKAAAAMLHSLLQVIRLPDGCDLSGVLIAPERPADLPAGVDYFAGGHPLPSPESFVGAQAVLTMVRKAAAGIATEPAFCFFLISGGASAMMELPLDTAITLDDTIAFHRALVHSGAPIDEMNCVRKHFSAVKGGRLGAAAGRMPCITLAVSDVPAGRLDVLASGPTLPDPSTVAECIEIVARYGLMEQFSTRVQEFFAGEIPETPKPDEFVAYAVTLVSDHEFAEAARRAAEERGFFTVVENACDNWDYKQATEFLLERLQELRGQHSRVCVVAPGEVMVQVSSNAEGAGGRNQHFALYAATLLKSEAGATTILSAGSDGIDGNSRFAGAVVNEGSLCDSGTREPALDALLRFDSATFLNSIGATIATGPTGHNLRDLRLLMAEGP